MPRTWKKRMRYVKRERRTDDPSFRQMAQTLRGRLSFNWSKLLSSATRRMLKAATGLTGGTLTWLENHINQNRMGYIRVRKHKIMTRQFHAALKTCYKHDKISKKEMKEAKRTWKEAMKNVKEEDKRKKLWGEQICVSEPNQ